MSAALALTVRTSRLALQALQPGDAHILHRIYQLEGVLRYFPNPTPPPLEKLQRFVAGQQAHWEQHGYGNWGIQVAGAGEIVGWAGLQFLPETGETEVGYLLAPACWGRGYATEAARAALEFGFERFAFEKIIALVHPENIASRRVIEKCGLQRIDRKIYFGIELVRYWIERSDYYAALPRMPDLGV